MTPERLARIEELYFDALACRESERDRFIADACGGDIELFREVTSLVATAPEGDGLLAGQVARAARKLEHGATQQWCGRRVGPYSMLSLLGAGGMGEVYLARDTKLERDVAIKVLPAGLADDLNHLLRFRREAKILASLNHPNIASIYGLEESEGVPCVVMELVPGDTLADRLRRGRMSIDAALHIAIQIGEGVEAAHDKGIIHRDLKPANIKVTPDGKVKVLDFGLAKAYAGEETNRSNLITGVATVDKNILGTPGYMSPEHARGQMVDRRTDIWAIGCILYQMLTGRPAFSGATTADVLAAVLDHAPDWTALAAGTPAWVVRLLQRCLQKDPNRRWRDIREVLTEIESHSKRGRSVFLQPYWKTAIAAFTVAAVIAGAYFTYQKVEAPPTPMSFGWLQLTALDNAVQPSLSPDGRMITFIRGGDNFNGIGEIYVKLLPDGEPVQLTHDGMGKLSPVFSPDGAHIAYTVIDRNFKWDTWSVPVLGGEPRPLLVNASGLTWIDTDHILFSEMEGRIHMFLATARESRGDSRKVYVPPHDRGMVHRSAISPDRKSVLVVEMDNSLSLPCRVVPFDGSSQGKQVGPPSGECEFAAWSPDGKWIYLNSNFGGTFHVWRQRFPDGEPEQITFGPTEEAGLAMAADGRSLVTSVGISDSRVWVHDENGERQVPSDGVAGIPSGSTRPPHVFSADANKLYYLVTRQMERSAVRELWAATIDKGTSDRVLPGVNVTGYDVASNGSQVAYVSPDNAHRPRLWIAPLDRHSPPRQVTPSEADNPCFAGDGTLFFRGVEGQFNFVFRMGKDGVVEKVVSEPIVFLAGCSPDGQWLLTTIASGKDAPGSMQVAYGLRQGPVPICRNCAPRWSRDGSMLYVVFLPRTFAIQLRDGEMFPKLPPGGITADNVMTLPIVKIYNDTPVPGGLYPSDSLSRYAFFRETTNRNIYRIPLR